MSKTKILHIITRLDRGGSAENALLSVIGLAERYEVTLISGPSAKPVSGLIEKAQAGGVKLVIIKNLIREINPWRDVKALLDIYRYIKAGNYDIVHTHSSKAGIVGRWAAYFAHASYLVHTPHGHIFYGYYSKLLTKFFIFLERMTALVSDKIVALTPQEAKDHLTFGIATPEKYAVIHSGVELSNFQNIKPSAHEIKTELGVHPDAPIVGSTGRLEEVKGHKYFIEAVPQIIKKVPGVYFLLVGEGKLRATLEQQCLDLEIEDRVIFTGWRDDIPQIMSVLDIFILSSLNEGQGKVLVEAMALQKPIVATRVGGVPDLIKDGQNGILVPPKDPSAIAVAVVELLANQHKAHQLGLEAGKEAIQYSAQQMVIKLETLYNELLGGES